jgi:hypothetical protein
MSEFAPLALGRTFVDNEVDVVLPVPVPHVGQETCPVAPTTIGDKPLNPALPTFPIGSCPVIPPLPVPAKLIAGTCVFSKRVKWATGVVLVMTSGAVPVATVEVKVWVVEIGSVVETVTPLSLIEELVITDAAENLEMKLVAPDPETVPVAQDPHNGSVPLLVKHVPFTPIAMRVPTPLW